MEELTWLQFQDACNKACKMIAPTWPMDRAIAVNPHWFRIEMPVRKVAARMALLAGIQVFPSPDEQLKAWNEGRISLGDLSEAIRQLPEANLDGLVAAISPERLKGRGFLEKLPLLVDVLDKDSECYKRLSWREAITHQISQTCGAYFDQHQAQWQPDRQQGLYEFWKDNLCHDHGIGVLMGLPSMAQAIERLPNKACEVEQWMVNQMSLSQEVWADYLESLLLTIHGWASWCAYLGWQAGLTGGKDFHLRDLLAIRLAWDELLLACSKGVKKNKAFLLLQEEWARAPSLIKEAERKLLIDEVWQLALEIGYQRDLAKRLSSVNKNRLSCEEIKTEIELQAVFCIDVRSEPFRRALESLSSKIQTIGFAGFFGLPISYTPLGTPAHRPQLPGLLSPNMEVTDCIESPDLESAAKNERQTRLAMTGQWLSGSRWPGTAFPFVEAVGLGYLWKLFKWILPGKKNRFREDLVGLPKRYHPICRPKLRGLNKEAKVELALQILHTMGLEKNFAPLVLLMGHGSQSTNNAHAASLDCGACGGQTGEVNARSLAEMLNELDVREGLEERGILIPKETVFLAALHNTTTDEIEIFDLHLTSIEAKNRWEKMRTIFSKASDLVRRERAPRLGIEAHSPEGVLLGQLHQRANDGAQTRPEWGLAGNAAFLIAPRSRSRDISLSGRSFLHDYEASKDVDGRVLESLMTAPMIVTHWINWQYHASTSEPNCFGSGNKILHNVVGGNLGVFEGNGGDLKIGLSRQSVHDGDRFVHEPLRITVIIDAPQASITAVIMKHSIVRHLVDNAWIHLWRFNENGFERYRQGAWVPVT